MRGRPDWATLITPTLPARADSGAFIYFIWCDDPIGHVKIGYAQNLVSRLSEMQTGCPYPLRIVAWFHTADPRQSELEMHFNFSAYHARGEWFRIGPRLEQEIERLRNAMRESIVEALTGPIEPDEIRLNAFTQPTPRSRARRRPAEHFPIPARNNATWEWRGRVRKS